MIYTLFSFSWVLSIFAFMLLILVACFCAAIIKALNVLFNNPFLSLSTNLHLLYPFFCLINHSCNCLFVHCVFFSFFFLFLYSFGVSLSSSFSILRTAINNLSLLLLAYLLNHKISVSTIFWTPINPVPPSRLDIHNGFSLHLG